MPSRSRPRLTKYNEGDVVGTWTVVSFIGGGGNADVWRARSGRTSVALKLLHRTDAEGYARFAREVEICATIDASKVAILPVVDSHLPDNPRRDRPWFAMPIAETAAEALAGGSLNQKVEAVRDTAATLAYPLQTEGINHRDVKPENFYIWNGRSVVGDFRLAKRPKDLALTKRTIGPYHHLPDEAFHDPNPDRELIDVFCLANSLWRLAVEEDYPPRGQIRAGDAKSLALLFPAEPYIGRLAALIEGATSTTPDRRPTLALFASQLTDWLATRSDVNEFEAEYEASETRKLAVLRWLVDHVRSEPVFDTLPYATPSDLDAPSEVAGLTEREVGAALVELIEERLVDGDAQYAFGRREPRHISHLFPRRSG